jgi:hypothetical protein
MDDGRTTCVGVDLDAHKPGQKPYEAARKFVDTARVLDVPLVVHSSKSGKGLHLRTMFKEPVETWLARALFVSIAMIAKVDRASAMDKVWPPASGYGVLALPYQASYAHRTKGTLALDSRTFQPVPKDQQLEEVLDAHIVDSQDLCGMLDFMGVRSENDAKLVSGTSFQTGTSRARAHGTSCTAEARQGMEQFIYYCEAAHYLRDNIANVSYDFWFGMATNFRLIEGGKEMFAAISKLDTARWKERDFERIWKGIKGGPRKCTNLDQNWRCPYSDKCPAKSPVAILHHLEKANKAKES